MSSSAKKFGTALQLRYRESPAPLKKCSAEAMCTITRRKEAVTKWTNTSKAARNIHAAMFCRASKTRSS